MICPKCKGETVMVDEGYDENNPLAPTRCYECQYVGLRREFK